MKRKDLEWGPVIVTEGPFAGRIGDLDDEDSEGGIIYFGTIRFHWNSTTLPLRIIRHVTTDDLLKRYQQIAHSIGIGPREIAPDEELDLLYELHYIQRTLDNRLIEASERQSGGPEVFLSHSSKDKELVRWIAVDLTAKGYRTWFDEWEISVGESIPRRISEGLEQSRVVLVCLSPNSVNSRWVEEEWQAKYWDEIQSRNIAVLPVLLQKCKVPSLLRNRKYADFTNSFSQGVEELSRGLRKLIKTTE